MNNLNIRWLNIIKIDGFTSNEYSAKTLLNGSNRLANYLVSIGIKSDDKIGICSENRAEYLYVVFGTFFVGATLVSINNNYNERMFLTFNKQIP